MNLYRLKELREDNDLMQKQVTELINYSQSAYSKYELGRRNIPLEVLVLMADYYGVSVDYVLGIDGK